MDSKDELNPQQRAAVEHGRGPALVLAGAGSGKTRVIAHRIARLIGTGAARPETILAVTFTNKAADEMRARVHALLGERRTAEPHISTFHSFCVRVLRRDIEQLGYRRDFSIYDTDDQKRLVKQLLSDAGVPESKLAPREALRRISLAKNHRISAPEYDLRFRSRDAEDIARLYGKYEARLRQANALDFDDLLLKTVELLERSRERRHHYGERFQYILVDEYQDTNRPQYEILRLLTSRHQNLFVVGDEDQSIYKFRGADIQNILRFEQDFPGAKLIKLEQNYRSTQNILRAASAVVANNVERKGKTLWTENPSGDVITVASAPSAREEAEWVCLRVQEILEEEPGWRIAVLYRANFLSRNFEETLKERRVPYAVVGSVAFFGRMEVKDMLAYLRVIFNPEDDAALLRIINTPPRAIGQTTVDLLVRAAADRGIPLTAALEQLAGDPAKGGRAQRALAAFQGHWKRWAALRDTATLAELLETILRDTAYRDMLERQETTEEAESRMANIEEFLRAASESKERGETVFEFLDRASLASDMDAYDPDARVSLMTVHSAKGLEFDAVFLAGLEEGLFPHSLSLDAPENVEEERRLCYVAMTRARRRLFLSWTPHRRGYGAEGAASAPPSRFLLEVPQQILDGPVELPDDGRERPHRRPSWNRDYDGGSKVRDGSPQTAALGVPEKIPSTMAELRTYLKAVSAGQKGAPAGKPLRSGARVRHPQFGDGVILSREKVGEDFRLVVSFGLAGRRILRERYAKLEPL